MVGAMFDRLTRSGAEPGTFADAGIAGAWRDLFPPELRIEERREEGQIFLRVEAPGIDPDRDVDIEVERGELSLTVRRHEPMRAGDEGTYCSEFSYGVLSRVIRLPDGSDGNAVSATYHDSILEIRIPSTEVAPPAHHVPVARI